MGVGMCGSRGALWGDRDTAVLFHRERVVAPFLPARPLAQQPPGLVSSSVKLDGCSKVPTRFPSQAWSLRAGEWPTAEGQMGGGGGSRCLRPECGPSTPHAALVVGALVGLLPVSEVACSPQMGPNARELFRLVEDFVDVIGFRMKDLRDAYQVTDNLGKPHPAAPLASARSSGPSLPASVSSLCPWAGPDPLQAAPQVSSVHRPDRCRAGAGMAVSDPDSVLDHARSPSPTHSPEARPTPPCRPGPCLLCPP